MLGNCFSQFAELRNAIRHSRTLTDVVVKDGEAALLWFGSVLASPRPSLVGAAQETA
jgi:hypothetical protein